MKIRVSLKASVDAVIDTATDFERRMKWDKDIYDYRMIYNTADMSVFRLYYSFKSPPTVSDRDFYLNHLYRRNYPEPGTSVLYAHSLPNSDECPIVPRRVRANMNILGFIFKEKIDEQTGKEMTDLFFVQQIDINGSIPKWLTNNLSKNVPKSWFKKFE